MIKELLTRWTRLPPRRQAAVIELYLDLLEQTLTGALLEDEGIKPAHSQNLSPSPYDEQARLRGADWPAHAHTMIGLTRMRSLRRQVIQVLEEDIPGDFIETGVWRGGACIFMRAILAAFDVRDRRVWVADSFVGLPPPNPDEYPADEGDTHHTVKFLAVPLDEVRQNFAKYSLLDSQVGFLEGWFKDTLPNAPIDRLAILRLDGDMYESTIQALNALYHKVSPGGFVTIDDYNIPHCRQAVTDFRAQNNIAGELAPIDERAVFWRKP
jgi:hypothetical protein